MYHIKSILSLPIAVTPAAEPIIRILPPVPIQYMQGIPRTGHPAQKNEHKLVLQQVRHL